MQKYFVYILRCADGSFYTGITSSIQRRLRQHQQRIGSSAYTKIRLPVELVYQEEFPDRISARLQEKRIKPLSRLNKIRLIESVRNQLQGSPRV